MTKFNFKYTGKNHVMERTYVCPYCKERYVADTGEEDKFCVYECPNCFSDVDLEPCNEEKVVKREVVNE